MTPGVWLFFFNLAKPAVKKNAPWDPEFPSSGFSGC